MGYVFGGEDVCSIFEFLFFIFYFIEVFFWCEVWYGVWWLIVISVLFKIVMVLVYVVWVVLLEIEWVGLIFVCNIGFVEGIGLYDCVFGYDELCELGSGVVVLVDFVGNGVILVVLYDVVVDDLKYLCLVGVIDW